MNTPITLNLGRFISQTQYEDIPSTALDPIYTAFADTIGVMVAGANETAPQLLRSMLSPTGTESKLVGQHGRASIVEAAWINGTAAHALDFDDISQRGLGHASASLVPAILAQAEVLGSSGQQMMAAYGIGYETITELVRRDADCGRFHDKGWHPTGIFGAIGSAAACASLLALSAEQSAMAISLSASQACGLIANVGTMTKPFHAGRAAHAGVVSARLVSAGFSAATDALEHAPGFLAAFSYGGNIDLDSPVRAGREWQICDGNRISVKKYPLCYCTHRTIDGMLDLLQAHPIEPTNVERIVVSISRRNADILRNHLPQTGLEAKFSIEFAVTVPLVARRAGLTELRDDFVLRPDVQALMQRVEITPDHRDNPDRPGYAIHDRIVVHTQDGLTFDSGPITNVRGDHDSPLRRDEQWTKFANCLAVNQMDISPQPLFETLMSLDRVKYAKELFALLG